MVTWLVIANSTKALIYDISKPAEPGQAHYRLLKELSHPESRLKTSELTSDRPGHYQSSGSSRGAYAAHSDPHHNEILAFAKEVSHYLDTAQEKNQYANLVLCAGPHFHGLLNQALSAKTASTIKKHIEKDYLPLPDKKLNEVIEGIYQQPFK
jgi:protein required for attachment to host cells